MIFNVGYLSIANKAHIQQILQVECLTVSVVAFVVTVELIALRGKMTDVARRECQRSAWENYNMLFPDRTLSFLPLEQHLSFCLATQSIQP